jgi:hypothetical protein
MTKKKDLFKGVVPSKNINSCITYESPKKGQSTFRIGRALLDRLFKNSKKVKKAPILVLTIPCNDKENYVLTCTVKREKI